MLNYAVRALIAIGAFIDLTDDAYWPLGNGGSRVADRIVPGEPLVALLGDVSAGGFRGLVTDQRPRGQR